MCVSRLTNNIVRYHVSDNLFRKTVQGCSLGMATELFKSRRTSKRNVLIVHGYCRRISEHSIIREVIDICVGYCNITDYFDPEHKYHGMTISQDDENIIYNKSCNDGWSTILGKASWSTILGKAIIKKNEIFSWNFEIVGQPKEIANEGKIMIGVIENCQVEECESSRNFGLPSQYRRLGMTKNDKYQFGNYEGDTMKMTLNLENCTLTFDINGVEKAHMFAINANIQRKEFRMAVSLCQGRQLKLVSSGFE